MFLNNMNSCSNTDLEDCKYEPTGINAQFGYNTANLMTKENCCTNKDCCDKNNAIRDEMMCKIRALKFAVTDIGEYLNTHSDDKRAICLHREYCQELRDLSGAGLMDCKKALEASNNDIDEAIDYLRKKGISKAAKKADRIAAEGLSTVVIDGNNASIVEVNCETDFVAKNEKFVNLVNKIAELIVKNDVKTMEKVL